MGSSQSQVSCAPFTMGNDKIKTGPGLLKNKHSFFVAEKFWTFTPGLDFKVRDASGNVQFRVDGKYWTLRDRMLLKSASGKPLAILQRNFISEIALTSTYEIMTFQPNYKGQKAHSEQEGAPLYQYARLDEQFFALTEVFMLEMARPGGKWEPLIESRVDIFDWFGMELNAKATKTGQHLLHAQQTEIIQFYGCACYEVSIAAHCDPATMILLVIANEHSREEEAERKRREESYY